MISINNHKQMELFDPWDFLSPKRRQMLDQSWPGFFQKKILPELPVLEVKPFFSSDFGRPTKELYTVLGALVLQQMRDLTDEETIDQLSFNIQWHYALKITEESDAAKYMCAKTLWSMRMIMIENNLDTVLFERVAKMLADVFDVTHFLTGLPENKSTDRKPFDNAINELGRLYLAPDKIPLEFGNLDSATIDVSK